MGLFSRRSSPQKHEATPPPETAPDAGTEQSTPAQGENPLSVTMPWLQTQTTTPSPGDGAPTSVPAADSAPPQPPTEAPAPQGETQTEKAAEKTGNGLSDDLRSLFASESAVDPEIQGLASGLEDLDVHQLVDLSKQVASLVRRQAS